MCIIIDKYIFVFVGFVGGSLDVVVVFKGLNVIWEFGFLIEELVEISLEIGFDIVFCVYGGIVLVIGCGEKIFVLFNIFGCWIVFVKLSISVFILIIYKEF